METVQKRVGKDVWCCYFKLHSSNDTIIPKDVGGGFLFHSFSSSFSVALKPGHILEK